MEPMIWGMLGYSMGMVSFMVMEAGGLLQVLFMLKDGEYFHNQRKKMLSKGDLVYIRTDDGKKVLKCYIDECYHSLNKYELIVPEIPKRNRYSTARNRLIHPKYLKKYLKPAERVLFFDNES
jgi:hypothetical protein